MNVHEMSHYSGIYAIQNKMTGDEYIGHSKDIHDRVMIHRSRLRAGNHPNPRLQKDFLEYGESAFHLIIIESLDDVHILRDRERHWQGIRKSSYSQIAASADFEAQTPKLEKIITQEGLELLDSREVAQLCGVTKRTVGIWRRSGALPAIIEKSGRPLYNRFDAVRVAHSLRPRRSRIGDSQTATREVVA